MIDVHQWRVTVGLWSCRFLPHLTKRSPHGVTTNTNCVNSLCLKLIIIGGNLISLIMFLFLVLILSGDVEVNPGPKIGKLNVVQSV